MTYEMHALNQRREHGAGELGLGADLLELAHDAIIVRHPDDSSVLFWNRGAEAMYGWSREEAMGQVTHTLLETVFPIPLADIDRQLAEHGFWDGELVHTTREGAQLVVASRQALQRDESGTPAAVMEINNDITERKRAEEALWTLNAELDERVRERTEQLEASLVREQAARERAENALRLRDEFLSIASHELRTPLTTLQLQMQLLDRALKRDGGLDRERIAATLQAGERQVKRLARLNDDLLDVSRIMAGQMELRHEEMDLSLLVREIVETMSSEGAEDSKVLVDASQSITGRWDRSRIEQVVTNLLSNALKFGRGNPVRVSVWGDGPVARLQVRDGGIGIPGSDLARIFGRFERAVSAQNYGGFGLGLYIVRQIVEAHGGSIRVESRTDIGSTFTVDLPREL